MQEITLATRPRVEGQPLLREEIEAEIRRHASDPAAAALAVCLLLVEEPAFIACDRFGDDDEVMEALGSIGA